MTFQQLLEAVAVDSPGNHGGLRKVTLGSLQATDQLRNPPTLMVEVFYDIRESGEEEEWHLDEQGNSKCGAILGYHKVTRAHRLFPRAKLDVLCEAKSNSTLPFGGIRSSHIPWAINLDDYYVARSSSV